MECIFYGAGRWADGHLKEWERQGLKPLCFCDTNMQLHFTRFNGYEILPLDEAMKKFPDAKIFISTSLGEVYDRIFAYLLEIGIDQDRILETVKGCHLLNHHLTVFPSCFQVCCNYGASELFIPCDEFCDESVQNALHSFYQIADDIAEGKKSSCDGCPNLGKIPPLKKLTSVTLGIGFINDACNAKCYYCNAKEMLHNTGDKSSGETAYNALKLFSDYEYLQVNLVNGELSVNKDCEKILSFIEHKPNWSAWVLTNGIIFLVQLARLINCNKGGGKHKFGLWYERDLSENKGS